MKRKEWMEEQGKSYDPAKFADSETKEEKEYVYDYDKTFDKNQQPVGDSNNEHKELGKEKQKEEKEAPYELFKDQKLSNIDINHLRQVEEMLLKNLENPTTPTEEQMMQEFEQLMNVADIIKLKMDTY